MEVSFSTNSFNFFYYRVVHLENGLTALLVSDTLSVTHRKHHDSDMSTTDDEDGCSEDLDDESDVDDDDNNSDDNGDDDVDGVIGEDPDMEQENDCERLRKAKDTKLVSFFRQIDYFERTLGAEELTPECKIPQANRMKIPP